ncbi:MULTISPECIES: EamA family transporter [Marinobacter]|jgi:drug/metabolite transporter (DMT)-like permease|uniref:DMT family transporter n=1 Tax=Marinobacter TaxID=2742 RepID=UPI000C8E98C1|nr:MULTISPECIES: EamA family transporter [Marinobacter]MAB52582.1 EamA family transporter [Marinobacter sp.]WOI21019.1 EamA family transporter [Marinobacter salarius]|tara:strand:+ start:682 stop:1545 length:864 start_codon:yes stop_codon:yes gene_type:complete
MPISVHYGLTVLIWGLTWTAIRLQVESAPVDVSVFYRFLMASGVALVVLALLGRLQTLTLKQHGWLFLQGLTLYSVNFLLIYRAAESMTSGLLAVVFSLAALFNALNGWLWLRLKPTARLYPAVALGITGVALLFWHDLQLGNATGASILFAAAGTFWFSMGNLVSIKVRLAQIPLLVANAWAMVYGAVILGVWCLLQGVEWVVPTSATFWGATVFLAVPGSIIAFYCYITVIQTLGADRAGYATVLFPVVALSVSTWLEGFEWTTTAVLGALLAILGNYVLFRRAS